MPDSSATKRSGLQRILVASITAIWMTLPAAGSVATHPEEALTLCYEAADVRPWRTADGRGLNFELIDAAARQAGIKVKYRALPWKRCLSELKESGVDGAVGASFKTDRLELGVYPGVGAPDATKRLYVDSYVVVGKRDSLLAWDGKTLSGLDGAVGVQLGYSIGDQLRAMNIQVDDGSTTAHELLLKLAAGRLGAAAVLGSEISYLTKQHPRLAQQLRVFPLPLVQKPYFVIFSHHLMASSPALAMQLWSALERNRNADWYRKKEARALESATR